MPELPEVETVRRGLQRAVVGERLLRTELRREDLRWPIPVRAVARLADRHLLDVDRRSKYLLLHFSGSEAPTAIVHLGMSGRLWVDRASADEQPDYEPHEHWRFDFGDRVMRFVDPRRFGSLDVAPAADLTDHKLLRDLGPEPLGEGFTVDYLHRDTRHRRVATKIYLMDARRVVGVGNIYATEACFRAGVRPGRGVGRLTRAECGRLVDAVRSVLDDAIQQGGTTLRDYIGVDRGTGYFQRYLSVYDRAGEACDRCGAEIKRIVQAARSTYYCPGCQA